MGTMSIYLPPHRCLLLLIAMHNYRIITFKDQEFYKNNETFKQAMKEMRLHGLVEARRSNGSLNEYKCTDKGQRLGDALFETVV